MDPDPTDEQQLKRIAEALERMVSELKTDADSPVLPSRLRTLTSSWPLMLFGLSLIGVLSGWIIFGVSPLQPLEEIAFRQREYRERRARTQLIDSMVARHIRLGNGFLGVGHLEAAQKEYEQALSKDPTAAAAHMGLLKTQVFGSLEERYYEPDIIRKRLQMILDENPKDPHALLFLGNLFAGRAGGGRVINLDSAVFYYKGSIRADSTMADAFESLGFLYYQNDQEDSAIAAFKKAAALSPWNPTYLDNLAYYDYLAGRAAKAVQQYTFITRVDPFYISPYYTLANAYRMAGDLDSALSKLLYLQVLIQDSLVMSKDKNDGCYEWRMPGDTLPVKALSCSVEDKKAHLLYSEAATLYLQGRERTASVIMRVLDSLPVYESFRDEIRDLVRADLNLLVRIQPRLQSRARSFISRYLVHD